MAKYHANLLDGRAIYIPSWSVKVQYENLTQACKYLGQQNVISISALNLPAAKLAIMEAEDHLMCTNVILHFIKQARIEGEKISNDEAIDKLGMTTVLELFTHVMHSQYADFFALGSAKEPSQPK